MQCGTALSDTQPRSQQTKLSVGRSLLSISPSRPGGLEFAEKYAKKLGDCQCVMPAARTRLGCESHEMYVSLGASGRYM